MVRRPRRRRGVGARRARHEGPGRGLGGRVRLARSARASCRPATWSSSSSPTRRWAAAETTATGSAGSSQAHPEAARLRLRGQRGGGRTAGARREAGLPVRDGREDVRAVQASRPRPQRPRLDARHRGQRARQGCALRRGARRVRAAAGADPGGARLPRGGARRGTAGRGGARAGAGARSHAAGARRAASRADALADDDRRVTPGERDSGALRGDRGLPAAPGADAGGRGAADPRRARRRATTSSSG